MCTAILLNYNDVDTVIQYIENVRGYCCFEHIVIVDNYSTDSSFEQLKNYESEMIKVIQTDYNGGYSYGNNFGIRYAVEEFNAEYILISNPDVVYDENVISTMEQYLHFHLEVGVVSPLMLTPNLMNSHLAAWKIPSMLQEVFENSMHRRFTEKLVGTHLYKDISDTSYVDRVVDCVPGSLLMVKSKYMMEIGLFDENIFLYCEETVLGIKMKRAGYKTVLLTNEHFIHYHSVSISRSIETEKKRMTIMWKSRMYVLERYYNINWFQKFFINIYSKYNIYELSK